MSDINEETLSGLNDEISKILGSSSKVTGDVMEETGYDSEKIRILIDDFAPAYLAVKVRLDMTKDALTAFFFGLFNAITGEAVEKKLWVGDAESMDLVNVQSGWESVRSAILSVSIPKGSLYPSLLELFDALFNATVINRISSDKDFKKNLPQILEDKILEKIKKRVFVTLATETTSRIRLEYAGVLVRKTSVEAARQGDDSMLDDLRFSSITVPCEPVLDPVNGVPVADLRVGDTADVEFKKTGGVADIINSTMKRNDRGAITLSVSDAKNIAASGNRKVTLALSDSVNAVFILPPNYKIRGVRKTAVPDAPDLEPPGGERRSKATPDTANYQMYALYTAAVVGVLFIFAILLLLIR